MAKYIYVPAKEMFTYALDECEDWIVLESYLYIKESGKFQQLKCIRIFEYYHLQEGGTLNDNILMQLNGSLRLLGRSSMIFVNGHTTNYAALRGQEKVELRAEILKKIREASPKERAALIARKHEEAGKLPVRDPGIPNRAPPVPGGLSRTEVENRRTAVFNSQLKEGRRQGQGDDSRQAAAVALSPPVVVEPDREAIPESTIQDNVVELISEMHDLRKEVASLKAMLQTIFKNV